MISSLAFSRMGGATIYRRWLPSAIDPSFWLDHSSGFSFVSGTVAAWLSHVNGFSFTQSVPGSRPAVVNAGLDGKNIVRFDGVNDFLRDSSAAARDLYRNTGFGWSFTIYKKRSSDNAARIIFYAPVSTGPSRFNVQAGLPSSPNRPVLSARRLDGDSTASLVSPDSYYDQWIMRLDIVNWSSGLGEIYIDGDISAQNGSLVSPGSTSDTSGAVGGLTIASNDLGSDNGDIDVACILAGSGTALSSGDIDKLFGWAAWQYNLQSQLPVGHPYKQSPPLMHL